MEDFTKTGQNEITPQPKDSRSTSTERNVTADSPNGHKDSHPAGSEELSRALGPTDNSCPLQVITKLSELASTTLESSVEPSTPSGSASKDCNYPVEEPDTPREINPTNTTRAAEKRDDEERGYDYELVDTEKEKVEMCPICCLIPRKPHKVECCGNVFCLNCIDLEKSCPLCRTDNFKSMKDKKCERKIKDLKVHCPNHNKGCEWTGELRNVEEHLKKDPSTGKGVRGCGYQLSLCEKCKEEVMYIKMQTHLEEDCHHRIIACEFEPVGCDFRGPKYQMLKHAQGDMLQHLSLMNEFVKQNDHREANSSTRHSLGEVSHVHLTLVISVGIILVGILAAILIDQQHTQEQMEEHNHHLSLLQDDWAALKKIRSIEEAELDIKLTNYRFQLNDLTIKLDLLKHDIDKVLHEEMKAQKEMLSKQAEVDRDMQSEILEQQEKLSNLITNFHKLVLDVKQLKDGFSKKYIDNTVKEMLKLFYPKELGGW